jgi:3D (Asp-Asp-Asp) domain-containing protein
MFTMKIFFNYTLTPVLCALMVILAVVAVVKQQEIDGLRHKLELAEQTAEARKGMVEEVRLLQKALTNSPVRTVTVTAYNPTADQCDDDPLIAASMRKVRQGTIAVSRDLFDQGWVFGRKVRIEGLGIFEINDLMNKRFTKRIDIFMWDETEARQFGKKNIRAALLAI